MYHKESLTQSSAVILSTNFGWSKAKQTSVQIWYNIVLGLCITRNHSPGLLRWSCIQILEGQRRRECHLVGLGNSETHATSSVHDPAIIERTLGHVLGPFTALNRSYLYIKHCNLNNKAVGTLWRALSEPPQRWQGPDPRPLALLVGTHSAFGPELAYRLRVAQPTLIFDA